MLRFVKSRLTGKKFVLVFGLLLILPLRIFSQQNFWQQTNGPYGAFALSLACDSSGGIYAGTMTQGLYKSNDGGYTWSRIGLEGKNINSILPYSINLIFVGTNDGVFHSTDGGINWIKNNIVINPKSFFTTQSGTILLGTNQEIYRSTDQGMTWQNVTTNIPNLSINSITIDSIGKLYAAASTKGILVSTDDGITWTQSNNGIPTTTCFVSTVFVKDNGHIFACISPINFSTQTGIYISTNRGLNWTRRTNSLTNVSQFAVNSNNELMAGVQDDGYGNGTQGVYYSNDLGWTWNPYPNQKTNLDVRALITIPGEHILVGNYYAGIFLSTDSGISWIEVNNGINNSDITDVYAISSGRIFCSRFSLYYGHGGVYYSDDEGNSWTKSNTGNVNPNVRVFFSDKDGNIYAGDDGIYRSTNNGNNWQQVKSAISVQCFTQTPGGTLFAGDYDLGIFRSTNSGLTWLESNSGLTYNTIFALTVTDLGTILAGTFEGIIFRSTDDGINWESINTFHNSTVLSLFKTKDNIILAGLNADWTRSMLKSSNDGITWEPVTAFTRESIRDITENTIGDIFAAGTYDGVYRSKDKGNSWSLLSNEGISNLRIQTISVSSSGYLYAGTWRGSLFRSYQSTTNVNDLNTFPTEFLLNQNFPNPFNPSTKISWQSPVSGWQTLKVYDILGREVATLVNEEKPAGSYEVEFNPSSINHHPSSGIYFYRLQAGDYVETKKMILLK